MTASPSVVHSSPTSNPPGPRIEQRAQGSCFINRQGRALRIVPGFAAGIFQRDRAVVTSGTGYAGVSDQAAGDMAGVCNRVTLGLHVIDTLIGARPSSNILVFGAGDGRECLWLAHETKAHVTGTDIRPHAQVGDAAWQGLAACVPDADRIRLQSNVELRRDDICQSTLPAESFDRVFSWQTFEHVVDPAAALHEIRRLLRPGGVAYLEYNPFFSVDGAHWAATIDIPWAHARLDREDLKAAVQWLHTDPQPWAADFVHQGINRLCLAELSMFATQAGLTTLSLLPRLRTEDLLQLDSTILTEVRDRFPAADLMDLGCRIVRIALRRPV